MNKKWVILAITTLASFMTPLDSSITNVAMPAIGNSFKATFALVAMVPLIYLLSLSIFMIPFGKLADIYGRKKFFIAGLFIFTIASLFSGIAPSINYLLVSRFVQGVGASLLAATATAIVTETFPPNERGKALGINVASVYVGLTLGPLIGGLLVQTLSWRYIFYINIPIGIIAFVLALIYIENVPEIVEKTKFNLIGALSLMISLFSVFGLRLFDKSFYFLIIFTGIFSFIIFLISELKSSNPIIGLKHLIKNNIFVFANITAFLNYIGLFAVSFILSFYLISVRNLSPINAGIILGLTPITMAILSPFAGNVSDKIGSRLLSSFGMAIISLGIFMLSFITVGSSIYFIAGSTILIGIGMGLFSSPNISAVMGSVEKSKLGMASSILGTIRFFGQSVSIVLMTLIISIFTSSELMKTLISGSKVNLVLAKSEFMLGLHYTFLIFATIVFMGIFTSLARKNEKKQIITPHIC